VKYLAGLLVCAIANGAAVPAMAQRFGRRGPFISDPSPVNYDGQFVIVRLWYSSYPGWSYDYPDMEQNLTLILKDVSYIRAHPDGSNIFRMDDPELGRYPVAYLSEPGYWRPDDSQAAGLRTWLAKGGFLIVDDFYGPYQWQNFEESMHKVLPNGRIVPLDVTHPIFDAFFHIKTLEGMSHPDQPGAWPAQYKGIFEDNDRSKRLMVIINYNNDIGDYMEWSGQGVYAINFSNDAYKLATNYVVYALTH